MFIVFSSNTRMLSADITRFNPKEIILSDKLFRDDDIRNSLVEHMKCVSTRANSVFDYMRAEKRIKDFYNVLSIEGLGKYGKADVCAIGSLIEYLGVYSKISYA